MHKTLNSRDDRETVCQEKDEEDLLSTIHGLGEYTKTAKRDGLRQPVIAITPGKD